MLLTSVSPLLYSDILGVGLFAVRVAELISISCLCSRWRSMVQSCGEVNFSFSFLKLKPILALILTCLLLRLWNLKNKPYPDHLLSLRPHLNHRQQRYRRHYSKWQKIVTQETEPVHACTELVIAGARGAVAASVHQICLINMLCLHSWPASYW